MKYTTPSISPSKFCCCIVSTQLARADYQANMTSNGT
ncbi:hypothetical protein CTAM01_03742 [Colletotrichum tamarilloi]|uniref:Uncharacterized protein n=1 Tax=Colletotrichum tamarilloi TaxID=1209934 RepID=A0ABQ9RIE5_9PEZI|nr:uncharacterized protein CTAM01_03742 [Colletotrichum tamarilloi]KAK1504435.1 hypothetical protein CTAM01_03742 [Colletotrichum tamarilloi]